MPPTTRQQNLSPFDRLQAEMLELRTANESLRREISALKGHNTRLKQQKANAESSEQEARNAAQKQYRLTESLTKKLDKAKEQYEQNLDEEARNHDEELEAEQEKRKILSDQNVRLKQKIAASSRLDNQITDETFRETMGCAFTAIHDCFYGVTRRQNSKMVFGYPSTELIDAATTCWDRMPEPQHPKARKKITQWLSLTREILTDKDQKSMADASGLILEDVLDKSHELLEGLTDLNFNDNMRKELSEAIEPFLQIMCTLPYQRWQYKFEMVPAVDERYWTSFDPTEMESMFVAENTGWLKASLFPRLCRLEWDDQDEVSGIRRLPDGLLVFIQNYKRTVICRARVVVKSHLPTMTNAMGQDTKMSDGLDDETKTGVESVEEEVTDKSPDIGKKSRIWRQDLDKVGERDVGEPMDEDTMVDALRAGSGVYIDLSETPERESSESGIPDSYDRAEEETIDQGRCWPA
ncbi:hypothetical protein KCU95_g17543, partial [Aureobasidium melanogenum]